MVAIRIPFDDMPSDDLGQDAPHREVNLAEAARQRFVSPKQPDASTDALRQGFWNPCGRCGGSGVVRPWGTCFRCNGRGGKMMKTSGEERARNRQQAAERRERSAKAIALENWKQFADASPAEAKWVEDNAGKFDFASSMLHDAERFGSLTDGKMAAIRRCMARDVERAAAKAAQAPAGMEAPNLFHVMQRLAKLEFGDLRLARKNQDSLVWIKWYGCDRVVGKIEGGKVSLWNREGFPRATAEVLLREIEKDPIAAAREHGKASGRCCVCCRDLTNEASIELGIGPVCLERMEGI